MNDASLCPSCDVAHTDHLGLTGTCAALREVLAERDRLVRIRAVACGDEEPPGEWRRDTTDCRWVVFRHPDGSHVTPWGVASWEWFCAPNGEIGWAKSALEGIDAVDNERGRDGSGRLK